MNITDFVRSFADLFEDTDISTFTPETKFKNLDEWSSMIALSVIAMADEEYNKELTGEDIRNSEKVQDLFDILNNA